MKQLFARKKRAYYLLFFLIAFGIYAIINREKETISVFAPDLNITLILDAGHGGADGGASSSFGLKESEVNLDIVLRMRELCRLLAVPVVLTRDSEELAYPSDADSVSDMKRWDTLNRVELINRQINGVLLSVHQNCYPNALPRGPQVFFSKNAYAEKLAAQIQYFMTKNLYPSNRRVAASMPVGLYIPEHIHCPSVLCECGFLSNPQEAADLATAEYRTKIALIMLSAYLLMTEGI